MHALTFKFYLLAGVVLLLLLNPFHSEVYAGDTSDQDLKPITLQLKWKHQFQSAGYYAAIDQGYFRDAGFDVSVREADGISEPADVVLRGDAEFGVAASDLVLLRSQGEPVVVLAAVYQHSPYIFLSLADSKIQSIHDLAGKRLMLEDHAAELIAYLIYESIPLTDIEFLPHTYDPSALINGEVDAISAYITDEPFLVGEEGLRYQMYNPRSVGIDFYGDVLFTTENYVRDNPELVSRFREAVLKGWEYALEHPREIAGLIFSEYSDRHSIDHLMFEAEQSVRLIVPELVELGYMQEGRWRHIAQTYAALGLMEPDFSLEGFMYEPEYQWYESDLTWLYWYLFISLAVLAAVSVVAWRFYVLHNRMEEEIRERKKYEADLVQARDEAREGLMAKSRFLANMTHEVRTPLQGIIGYTELITATDLSPEQQKYAGVIRQSAENMLELVNDILDFSKIDAGKYELNLQPGSIHTLVNKIDDFYSAPAQQKGIRFEVNVDDQLPDSLKMDERALRQTLMNLCSNAVKFTQRGSVQLNVKRLTGDHFEKAYAYNTGETRIHGVRFEVSDTGIGIPKPSHDKIFEMFSQADPSIMQQYGGTGLGLAIVSGLVKAMGGQIKLDSESGEGSRFWFDLALEECKEQQKGSDSTPAVRDENPQYSDLSDSKVSQNQRVSQKLHKKNVLVAEDDPVNAQLMIRYLEKVAPGCNIILAENGKSAVEKWKESGPVLTFMDYHMPVMDGAEAVREIRDYERQNGTWPSKIVVLSAREWEDNISTDNKNSFDRYLSKPLRMSQLYDLIESFYPGADDSVIEPDGVTNDSDMSGFWAQFEGDDEFKQTILEILQTEIPKMTEQMKDALDNDDDKALKSAAHRIKGTAAGLQLNFIAEDAKRLEKDSLSTKQRRELLEKITHEFSEITLKLSE